MVSTGRTVRAAGRSVVALAAVVTALVAGTSAQATGWLPHSLVFPSGVTQEQLFGVGCASTTSCLAAGEDYNGNWGIHAEVGAGSSWVFQSGMTRIANSVLFGSSCPSTTWCLAAGYKGTSGGPEAQAQIRNGSTWTYNNVGVPAGATTSALNGVSCLSSSWCMTAGYKMVSGDDKPFTASFNGSTWTHTTTATASNATLLGVSCTSTTYCVAVGATGGSALAEVWNGTSWSTTSAVATPPNGSNYALRSISCVSSTWCIAVGSWQTRSSGVWPFSSVWNGTSWSNGANMPFPGTSGTAYGVSCLSTTLCHAVGESGTQLLTDVWLGGSAFTTEPSTLPSGASGGTLRGISCVSAAHCEASGWSYFSGTPTGLIETYS